MPHSPWCMGNVASNSLMWPMPLSSKVSKVTGYSSLQVPHRYGNSRAIWDHSVTCHLAEVTFPPLPQLIKAGTRISDPGGMQGWVDLVGLVTYWGGIPAWRRSPIPVLTGPNVEQLHSCDKQCYSYAKPPLPQGQIVPLSSLNCSYQLKDVVLLEARHLPYPNWQCHSTEGNLTDGQTLSHNHFGPTVLSVAPLVHCVVCLSVSFSIVARNCLKERIGNQGKKVDFLGRRHISTSGFASTVTETAVFALLLPVQLSDWY